MAEPDVVSISSLPMLTAEIKTLLHRVTSDLVVIGDKLRQVKALLPHGEWLPWLRREFQWSEATALRLMQVAQRFGDVPLAELPIEPTALYILAAPSTPDAAIADAVQRARQGEVISPTKARTVVAQHRPPPSFPAPPAAAPPEGDAARAALPWSFEDFTVEEWHLTPEMRLIPRVQWLLVEVRTEATAAEELLAQLSQLPGVVGVSPFGSREELRASLLREAPRDG